MNGRPARNGPLRRLLMRLSRRYKLRRICKALEIKPFGWQQDFALEPYPPRIPAWLRGGRCNGKTTAVILRLLLLPVNAPKGGRTADPAGGSGARALGRVPRALVCPGVPALLRRLHAGGHSHPLSRHRTPGGLWRRGDNYPGTDALTAAV